MKKSIIGRRDWPTIICIFSLACPIALNSILVNAVERVKLGESSHTSAHESKPERVETPPGQQMGESLGASNHRVTSGLSNEGKHTSDSTTLSEGLPGNNESRLQVVTGKPSDLPRNVDHGFDLTDIHNHGGPPKPTEASTSTLPLTASSASETRTSISTLSEKLSNKEFQTQFIDRLKKIKEENRADYLKSDMPQLIKELYDFVCPEGTPDYFNSGALGDALKNKFSPGSGSKGFFETLKDMTPKKRKANSLVDTIAKKMEENNINTGHLQDILHELATGDPPARSQKDGIRVVHPETLIKLRSLNTTTEQALLAKLLGRRLVIDIGERSIEGSVMNLHYYKRVANGKASYTKTNYIGFVPLEIFKKNARLDPLREEIIFSDNNTQAAKYDPDARIMCLADDNQQSGVAINTSDTRSYNLEIDSITGLIFVKRTNEEKIYPRFSEKVANPSSEGASNSPKDNQTGPSTPPLTGSNASEIRTSISTLSEKLSNKEFQTQFIDRLKKIKEENREKYFISKVKPIIGELHDFVCPEGKPDYSNIGALSESFKNKLNPYSGFKIGPEALTDASSQKVKAKSLVDSITDETDGLFIEEMRNALHELTTGDQPVRTPVDNIRLAYPETMKRRDWNEKTKQAFLSKLLGSRLILDTEERGIGKIEGTVMNLHYYIRTKGANGQVNYSRTSHIGFIPDKIFNENASLNPFKSEIRYADNNTEVAGCDPATGRFTTPINNHSYKPEIVGAVDTNQQHGLAINTDRLESYILDIFDSNGAVYVESPYHAPGLSGRKLYPKFLAQAMRPPNPSPFHAVFGQRFGLPDPRGS